MSGQTLPLKRSVGALRTRRVPLPWPEDRIFRILSIDGGGIRGVFSSSFLAGLEERYLSGRSIGDYFDLIAGTSTGGIIALGLANGIGAGDIRDLYVDRGCEIFPPVPDGVGGSFVTRLRSLWQLFSYRYDRSALLAILNEIFGFRLLGESKTRLCIPAFEGVHGETYIFKTPHHPDFTKDAFEPLAKVAASTSAAPTFFRPLEDGGYTFVDGGLFANDPVMVALVDALTCFEVGRENVRILSIGCGGAPYRVNKSRMKGGKLAWRDVVEGAIHLQSLNVQGQASLLVGADHVMRVEPPQTLRGIALDDWKRSTEELAPASAPIVDQRGDMIAETFLLRPAMPYTPFLCTADGG